MEKKKWKKLMKKGEEEEEVEIEIAKTLIN